MRVIMIDIDTLRADHMGCYGYGRNTTPVMDAVAKQSVYAVSQGRDAHRILLHLRRKTQRMVVQQRLP